MNGIFTRQSWEERSLFFHTKRGNKQCKANSTVSERTEDVVVPRLYKSKNKQQFVNYFAVHFFSLRSKTYFERPAGTGNQFPVLSVPNYAPNTILEFQRIENHFTNNEWNFKKNILLDRMLQRAHFFQLQTQTRNRRMNLRHTRWQRSSRYRWRSRYEIWILESHVDCCSPIQSFSEK